MNCAGVRNLLTRTLWRGLSHPGRVSHTGLGTAPLLQVLVWYHAHTMGYAVRGKRGHRPAGTWAGPKALVIYQGPTLVAELPCRKWRISVDWLGKYVLFGAYLLDIPLP